MTEFTYGLFIDGKWDDGEGVDVLKVTNPATEEIIGIVPQATAKDVARAVDAARRAFDSGPWPGLSVNERSAALLRFADGLDRRRDELADLNRREAGTVAALAGGQVDTPIGAFRDMAERAMHSFPYEQAQLPFVGSGIGQGVNLREPFGVAGLISAYNFPLFLNLMKLGPALASGCTVVLKPAPTTPLEALVLGEIALEAGLPPGVLNIVTGDVAGGQELTTNPAVDLISFTGSDVVGRMVYAQAAPTLKKVVLELGGKSANIICADADFARVIPDVVMGMTLHAGQGCALLTRTLVHESRYEELVAGVTEVLAQLKVGDPADSASAMGPLISSAQRTKVESLIETGRQEGAEVAFGGGRPKDLDKGFYVEPTLFVDVENTMSVAQQEFFGPVGVIIPVCDDDTAVRLANESEYGLGGGVWAKDPARAYAIARRLRTGTVIVNGGGGGLTPYAAFGGYKQSGLGREWGEHGLSEFLQTKSITWGVASG
jgi:acyl-CoA reductase-like NAD-dependent aldehyde dehydrogenase